MRNIKKIIYVSGCLIVLLITTCKDKDGVTNDNHSHPAITQISPDSSRFGTEVTITEINFGVAFEENTITFIGSEAEVISALKASWLQ